MLHKKSTCWSIFVLVHTLDLKFAVWRMESGRQYGSVFRTHSEHTADSLSVAQCSFSLRGLQCGSVRRAWFPFAQMQPRLQILKGDLSDRIAAHNTHNGVRPWP
jgi:hypothetical protein